MEYHNIPGVVLMLGYLLNFFLVQHLFFLELVLLPLPRFQSHSPDFPHQELVVTRLGNSFGYGDLSRLGYLTQIDPKKSSSWGIKWVPGKTDSFRKILNSKRHISMGPSLLPGDEINAEDFCQKTEEWLRFWSSQCSTFDLKRNMLY